MKGQRIAHSDSGSKNNARGSLSHSRAFAADRSPPLSPPKSWAWWIEQEGSLIGLSWTIDPGMAHQPTTTLG